MPALDSSGGLHVTMFGVPKLVLDGRPVALKAPPRTLPLLMSLLLEPRSATGGRDRLASRLWPDVFAAEARKNLRRHLSYLRKAFDEWGIAAPDLGELSLGHGAVAWTDVRAFEKLATGGSGTAAAALYTAPLLAGYDEEWLAPHRERYRRQFIELVLRLAENDWSTGRAANAFERVRASLDIEPYAEEFVQAALRLSMEVGDDEAGFALFDRFAARLRADFDEEPDRETTSLVERLKRRAPAVTLPVSVEAFVGREDELRELSVALQTRRAIALHGPPGIGKSRLAAALAAREASRFADGVWWVDLGRIEDGRSIETHALRVFGIKSGAGSVSLAERLSAKSALVIFDECEHFPDDVCSLVASLLAASAGIRVVTTSIRRLGVPGGMEWSVEPLRTADAVALFIERASAVAPRAFSPAKEGATVASICSALDGIPLAIELAARRTRAKPLAVILGEANVSTDPAVEGALGRAIAFLSPEARRCFARLGPFRGEFNSETAAAVCDVPEPVAALLLEELVASNLVAISSLEAGVRYDMLNTMRSFAHKLLGDERERASRRFAEYFGRRIVAIDLKLRGSSAFDFYGPVEVEYPNVVAALETLLEWDDTIELAARMCLALSRFWYDRGYLSDAEKFTALAIARLPKGDQPSLLDAELAWVFAWLRRNNGDFQQSHRECLAALEGIVAAGAPPRRIAFSEILVANAARMIGNFDEAAERAARALETFQTLGERYYIGYAHLTCGTVELAAGNVDVAQKHLVEALHAYEETGAKADAALALLDLVVCAYAQGELDLAETMARESAERCVEVGNLYFLAHANHGVALVLVRRREWTSAIRTLSLVARSAREFGDRELIATCAELAAEILVAAGRHTTAAILLGAADAERGRAGAARAKIYDAEHDALRSAIAAKLGSGAAEHARSVGAALAHRDLSGRIDIALRDAARLLASKEPRAAIVR